MREIRIKALQEMLDLNDSDGFALYGLALEYKADGRLEDALPLLERAVALQEPQVYAFYQLGEVLLGLGEHEQALSRIDVGIEHAKAAQDLKAVRELGELRQTVSDA